MGNGERKAVVNHLASHEHNVKANAVRYTCPDQYSYLYKVSANFWDCFQVEGDGGDPDYRSACVCQLPPHDSLTVDAAPSTRGDATAVVAMATVLGAVGIAARRRLAAVAAQGSPMVYSEIPMM